MSSVLNGFRHAKRKRSDVSSQLSEIHLTKPIVLQAADDHDKQAAERVELRPKLLVPRGCLPFVFTKRDSDHQPCLFRSNIPVLEPTSDAGLQASAQVLIAVSVTDHALFAIERVRTGTYALCSLEDWVDLDELEGRTAKRAKQSNDDQNWSQPGVGPWWNRAALSAANTTMPRPSSPVGPKLSMMPSKENRNRDLPTNIMQAKPTSSRDATVEAAPVDDPEVTQSPDAISDALRSKYLEALYISKTSLAYFAKGPLARARNFLQNTTDTQTCQDFLVSFQDMIINISTGDKKYSTTLPEILKAVPVGIMEEEDIIDQTQGLCKKGRRRKRLSKGGLLPFEEEHIVQWWSEKEKRAETVDLETSQAARIKTSLAKQRTRETQLQMILILEMLAAEKSKKDPGHLQVENSAEGSKPNDGGKKSKKAPNFQSLLDIHVDRLCIWQTTQSGFDADGSTLRPRTSHGSISANALQDFCTEVLVPFFASRIPHTLTQLCKKMGTVGAPSPARPAAKKPAHPKPGSAVPRRTLQRVSTDSAIHRKTPSLSRSMTDSLTAGMKRETSEIRLDDIPAHKPRAQPNLRYAQREVDLDALTKATDAKMKRKALLEQELQSAINVLKKPNSRMAVKEYVDFSEERSGSKSKRKREPTQHPTAPSPLVKATPRAKRVRTDCTYEQAGVQEPEIVIPPSSEQRMPSTSQHRPTTVPVGSAGYTSLPTTIEATPSKRSSGLLAVPPFSIIEATPRKQTRQRARLDPGTLVEDAGDALVVSSSPLVTRRVGPSQSVAHTPQKSSAGFVVPPFHAKNELVAVTPVKGREMREHISVTGSRGIREGAQIESKRPANQQTSPVREEDFDVYKALGWDDEDDVP